MGGTQNDFIMTVLSISMKQYLTNYTNDTTTEMIKLAVPFSLRPKPLHIMDFTFDNQVGVLPLKLRLFTNFDDGFKQLSKEFNSVKQSITPFAMVHMHRIICNFPRVIRDWVFNDFSKRITFSFNFVRGSHNTQTIANCKSIS